MFSTLYHTILYQPMFNLFVGLYNIFPYHDVGIAILLITIVVRLVVYPLTSSAIKAQKSMQEIQPKMEALKKQYADDKQKQAQALMDLYKTHKVNPFASCLPLLVQLPILIALYSVLRNALASKGLAEVLYSFVTNPITINPISFGMFAMDKPNIILALLAGAAQYWQAKMSLAKQPPKEAGAGAKDENMAAMMSKQMLYMMPVMTVIIGFSLPAGLTLYWFFSTVLMGLQQVFMLRKNKNNSNKPTGVIEGEIVK